MNSAGYKVTSLHGDRSQGQRQSALKGFKDGTHQIMVATDIAARGLDVESISHVINYDMPDTADAYIHRIGRTGRAQRTGDAFTLVTAEDNDMIRISNASWEARSNAKCSKDSTTRCQPLPVLPAVSAVVASRARARVRRVPRAHRQVMERIDWVPVAKSN